MLLWVRFESAIEHVSPDSCKDRNTSHQRGMGSPHWCWLPAALGGPRGSIRADGGKGGRVRAQHRAENRPSAPLLCGDVLRLLRVCMHACMYWSVGTRTCRRVAEG